MRVILQFIILYVLFKNYIFDENIQEMYANIQFTIFNFCVCLKIIPIML
jgi:hypothetical protein